MHSDKYIGILYAKAFGSFTYGLPTPVTQTNPKVALDVCNAQVNSLHPVI